MREAVYGRLLAIELRWPCGEYSVVAICCLALTVALTLAISTTINAAVLPLVVGFAGGVTLGIGVRLLAADRTGAMPLGGLLAPVGTSAVFAAPATGVRRHGVAGAGAGVGGVVLGLGVGLVVAQAFAHDRPRRAASRHLIASVTVATLSVLGVLVVAGPVNELFRAASRVGSTVTGALGSTADPISTAGPTLLLASMGLLATGATLNELPVPSVLTAETRSRVRAVSKRWAGLLRRTGLAVLVGGTGLVFADVTGSLVRLVASVQFARFPLAALGSGFARTVAVVLVLLGVGSLVAVALVDWLRSLTLQQVTVATLPTLGLVAGCLVVVVAAVTTVPSSALGSLPIAGDVLAGSGSGVGRVGLGVGLAITLVILSAAAVTALHLLDRTLAGETPGVTLAATGVAITGFVALVASSPLTGFALFGLAVFVTDVGTYGWTVGSELGLRTGARAEVLHALASALVAVLGIAVAQSLVGVATSGGPTLSAFHYALGAGAVALVLLTIGRQLSTG